MLHRLADAAGDPQRRERGGDERRQRDLEHGFFQFPGGGQFGRQGALQGDPDGIFPEELQGLKEGHVGFTAEIDHFAHGRTAVVSHTVAGHRRGQVRLERRGKDARGWLGRIGNESHFEPGGVLDGLREGGVDGVGDAIPGRHIGERRVERHNHQHMQLAAKVGVVAGLLHVGLGGGLDQVLEGADILLAEFLVGRGQQFALGRKNGDDRRLHPLRVAEQGGTQGVGIDRVLHQERLDGGITTHDLRAAGQVVDAFIQVLVENARADLQVLLDVVAGVALVEIRDQLIYRHLHHGDQPGQEQHELPAEVAETEDPESHDQR